MSPEQRDHPFQGVDGPLAIADAAAQLGAIARYVAKTREDLVEREGQGDVPALDGEEALAFAEEARVVPLGDVAGNTIAVVVSPAVLEVLEDAVGLLQGELDRQRSESTPMTTEELRGRLKGQATS